jgi:hypothetical protein
MPSHVQVFVCNKKSTAKVTFVVGVDVERLVKVSGNEKQTSATDDATPRLVATTPRDLRMKLNKFVKTQGQFSFTSF